MRKHHYSLIEMLVVITIIALLAGLAFPAYNTIRRKSRETAAVAGCNNLAMALKQFETTYSKFPSVVTLTAKTPVGGDSSAANYDLVLGVLTGIKAGSTNEFSNGTNDWKYYNPRKIKFLDPSEKYLKKSYVNPWNQRYYIYWNTDGSNKLEFYRPKNGAINASLSTITILSDVAVFSEVNPEDSAYKTGGRLATSWGGMKNFE